MNEERLRQEVRRILKENLFNEQDKKRVKFNLEVPEDVIKINEAFNKNGFEIYVVGGAVRDALMGKTPKDWDLATEATPDKIMNILEQLPFITNIKLVGERFGIIMAVTDNDEYEIATFQERDESKLQDTGEIDVKFSDMEGDISRRDLTINALFYDINNKEIIDLVGGVEDIKNNVIRSVGKAEDRFEDDSIRKLRAIRFAARVGSELDPGIDVALKTDPSIHPKVAAEPIKDEFLKGIKQAKSKPVYINMLKKYGMFDYIFPGLKINGAVEEEDFIVLLSVLLNLNNPKELRSKLSGGSGSLQYPSDVADKISFLVGLKSLSLDNAIPFKKVQNQKKISNEEVLKFAKWMNLDSKLIDAFTRFEFSVTGKDAQDAGIKPGPEMGEFIKNKEEENFKSLL
jgi:tRNA nucleotidyltransferase/poly(A) polymerase